MLVITRIRDCSFEKESLTTKIGKSPGEDGMRRKMQQYGGTVRSKHRCKLMKICLATLREPYDGTTAVMVPVFKRMQNAIITEQSVCPVQEMCMKKKLIDRVQQETVSQVWNVQGGIISRRGRRDQMFAMQQVIEKCPGVNKKVYPVSLIQKIGVNWGVFQMSMVYQNIFWRQ